MIRRSAAAALAIRRFMSVLPSFGIRDAATRPSVLFEESKRPPESVVGGRRAEILAKP